MGCEWWLVREFGMSLILEQIATDGEYALEAMRAETFMVLRMTTRGAGITFVVGD